MMNETLPIIEAYPCLQSEGKYTGIPHLLIRTSGCPMRCQFSNTDFCDSWYTSWAPEKGRFSIDDIVELFKSFPHIRHTMITGGSPTLNEQLLKDLVGVAKNFDHHITIETEGSKAVITDADFISLSPKLSCSTPRVGTMTPNGKTVTLRDKERHEKHRMNYEEMQMMIVSHKDYQLKPVISQESDIAEVQDIQQYLDIPNDKVWLMPAGGTEDELRDKRQWLMEYCWANGYNYTDRIHIIAYGDKRGV